ncbi:MAG: nucleotidyltransferase family protein [Gammaproteobacteria bacterium]
MTTEETEHPSLTALVLAASRKGGQDPLASMQNKSHKCLVEVDGIAMIERVIQTLMDSGCFDRILVSIESEQPLLQLDATRLWLDNDDIEIVRSADNLADSLVNLVPKADQILPMVVTTADNALHTPELMRDFVTGFLEKGEDAAVAVTTEESVLAEYPDEKIMYFRFRDGGYSFCNLFGIATLGGLEAARIFRTGGQFRKRPRRILKIFGLMPLILYKFRLAGLDAVIRRISKRFGITINIVRLDYGFGPIDIDNEKTFAIGERTLKKRREASEL